MNLKKELDLAKDLAIKAGEEIIKVYEDTIEVEYKDDKSPLTLADKKSNDSIVPEIEKQYPTHSILCEEIKDDKSRLNNEWCWIIDPLDGTKEFIKRNGEFTVNIALTYKQKPILGVIYVPVSKELYYAVKDNGAYYEKNGKVTQIKVSDKTEDIRLVMSRSHASEKLKELIEKYNIKNSISAGSSLKGCLIAKGDAEAYYRFGLTMEWDTCAMQCIVEESGGIFKQMDDTEMLYNRENSLNDKGFYIINKIENKLH